MPARNRYYQIQPRHDAEWLAITSTGDTCFPTYQDARGTMSRLRLDHISDPVVVRVDYVRGGPTLLVSARVIESAEQDDLPISLFAITGDAETEQDAMVTDNAPRRLGDWFSELIPPAADRKDSE